MLKGFQLFGRAISLWWHEWMHLAFLNIVWLALQVTIVAGPPATAAMYSVAQRVSDDEYLDLRHYWQALRQVFWPAWKWGALNLAVVIAVAGNFYFYSSASGPLIALLRVIWANIAAWWFIINLFYWPFWLAQEDHRMFTTYRNCLVLVSKKPLFILCLAVLSAALVVVSALTTLPLAVLLMAWLALLGVLVVKEELKMD